MNLGSNSCRGARNKAALHPEVGVHSMPTGSPVEVRFRLHERLRPAGEATEQIPAGRFGRLPRITQVLVSRYTWKI